MKNISSIFLRPKFVRLFSKKGLVTRVLPKKMKFGSTRIYYAMRWSKKKHRFIGNAFYCPCCNMEFSSFESWHVSESKSKDFYAESTPDCVCPYCGSLPRHRIICSYLKENSRELFKPESKTILFSPFLGICMWFKRNKIPFLSADINPTYIDVRVDIQDIPFSDNEFWFISCDHVLEHVQDYRLAIRELYRVCKPGGYVEISVPLMESIPATCEDKTITTSEECKTKYGQKDHLRLFGADFDKYLLNAGFEVSIYDGNQCDTRILPVIGPAIHDYNKLYICFKPLL